MTRSADSPSGPAPRRPRFSLADAYHKLMRHPPAQREAVARRRYGDDPEVLNALLPLIGSDDDDDSFLADVTAMATQPERAPRPDTRRGRVLGRRWKLGRKLGRGGQGVVCRATDLRTGGAAAVKLVRGVGRSAGERIRREVATLRWLRLPGVVQVYDDGEDGEDLWIAMELIRGKPFPGTERRTTWERAERTVILLFEAIGRVHAAGVVHGDVKPQNVLVLPDGRPVVLDLGLAAAQEDQARAGPRAVSGMTPGYAAPECLDGRAADMASDLYSAGALVYDALTGRTPDPDSPPSCRDLPAPRRAREAIRALLRGPGERPRTAAAVLEALRPRRRHRRRPWSERELRARFAGPDRFLHLREDGARELFLRTGGDPAAVEHELSGWLDDGLAHREGRLVRVDRASLDRLPSVPPRFPALALRRRRSPLLRADQEFARTLEDPSSTDRRIARSGLRLAHAALSAGRASHALTALAECVAPSRRTGDVRLRREVLRLALEAALATGLAREIDRALWLLDRDGDTDAEVVALAAVGRAAERVLADEAQQGWRLARTVTRRGPESARPLAWSVALVAAQSMSVEVHYRTLRAARRWAHLTSRRAAGGLLSRWEAWFLYRNGRCEEAARRHLAAAERAPRRHVRLTSLSSAAVAFLDAGEHGRALDLARTVSREARTLRVSLHEARAALLARDARRRMGTRLRAASEAPDEYAALGALRLANECRLVEATIAAARGEHDVAIRMLGPLFALRDAGLESFQATSLAAASGHRVRADRARSIALGIRSLATDAVAVQLLALLAAGLPRLRGWLLRRSTRLALPSGASERARMREFLSIDESLRILRGE